MKTQKRRGLLAKAGALLAVATLAFSASPSYAQTTGIPEKSGVTITKLGQPDTAGAAATGVENLEAGAQGISGVVFEAYEVTLNAQAGTNDWQREIAATTLETAEDKIGVSPVRSGTTDDSGRISWTGDNETTGDLKRGLYLIRETSTPEGVIPAGDFLLTVPMTNPDRNGWLEDIYVYPKGATFTASKTVENTSDYAVGDTVTWTINADIPIIRSHSAGDLLAPDRFEIVDTFKTNELALVGAAGGVNVNLPRSLTKGVDGTGDYYVEIAEEAGTTTVKIIFTDDGRNKLLAALEDGTDEVTVTLDTRVLKAGEIVTNAMVYSTDDERALGLPLAPQTVKYGNITLVKTDTNEASAAGAVFRVYANEESAKAKDDTYLTTASKPDGEWTTGEDGTVLLDGFRYSAFANGDSVEEHKYWLVEMTAPPGQQLLAEPISFIIDSHDESETLDVINTANNNAFVLPLTGGTGTALLTILGLGILAIVVFVARSRRNAEA